MGKYSERSKQYTAQYFKEHLDEFKVRVPKGAKDYYKAAAAAAGLSLNEFAIKAMNEKIATDKLRTPEMWEALTNVRKNIGIDTPPYPKE